MQPAKPAATGPVFSPVFRPQTPFAFCSNMGFFGLGAALGAMYDLVLVGSRQLRFYTKVSVLLGFQSLVPMSIY
jgi:hypothetical protein